MFTKKQIQDIVIREIESDEKLGTVKGGGDHIGDISYQIEKIYEPVRKEGGWEITYEYTTITVSEFTIYPDNPPLEMTYIVSIIVSGSGEILTQSEKKTLKSEGGRDIKDMLPSDL